MLNPRWISISMRRMKDSQQVCLVEIGANKYIKANNERFSTKTPPLTIRK